MSICEETGLRLPEAQETSADTGDGRTVAFPYHEACHAIATCRRIARMLDRHLGERADAADQLDHWTGGHRDDFEKHSSSQECLLCNLKEALDSFAGAVEAAWETGLELT